MQSEFDASLKSITWTLAGSDSGAGAGIQADLKTMQGLGSYACTVITALTAQNTQGVMSIETPAPEFVRQQIQALAVDLSPKALKIGMLPTPEIAQVVTEEIKNLKAFKLYDPVMVSSSGQSLMAAETRSVLIEKLFPQLDLITPNLEEAASILGVPIETPQAIEAAAQQFLNYGVASVLIKGGHQTGQYCQDYWTNGKQAFWLTTPKLDTRHTHGTGCTLSAAITACMALGYTLPDALVIAKAYVNQGLRNAPGLGKGHGPLAHLGWPQAQEDLPWLTPTAEEGQNRLQFLAPTIPNSSVIARRFSTGEMPWQSGSQESIVTSPQIATSVLPAAIPPRNDDLCKESLGFYPIVNRVAWMEKLLPLGVSTIQLRVKDLEGDALEAEIQQAVALAEAYQCRLFINDYWALALKYQAYGVHLGQDDLETADLKALAAAGIRLGVSTHCHYEVARALALQPSYIAIGPVFETTTKPMAFAPQGLEKLAYWCKALNYPLVAIGGIFLENAPEVLNTGAEGLAVVRDVTEATDLPARVLAWQQLLEPGFNAPSQAECTGVAPVS